MLLRRAAGLRQEPSRGDLGARGRRAHRCRRARSTAPMCRRRSRPARWCSRISPKALRRARAVPPAQPRARGARLSSCSPRAARRPAGGSRCPISPRGCARCRRWRLTAPDDALLRAVLVKLFADRQLAVDESLVGLSGDPDRALVRGAPARRSTRSTARRCACKRPVTRALAGGAVPGALTSIAGSGDAWSFGALSS